MCWTPVVQVSSTYMDKTLTVSARSRYSAPVVVDQSVLVPPRHRMSIIFAAPEIRPPVYEELVADMTNIIHKTAAGYVDQSCVELHFDNIVADCWAKTTVMIHKGLMLRSVNRYEYFKQYATAIKNHVRSMVQKHIFTEKRTGAKPPPKDQRNVCTGVSAKPQEIRIDDPDSGFQATSTENETGSDSPAFRELMEDVASRLDAKERLVLEQLVSPNPEALFWARCESYCAHEPGTPLRIRIRQEHLALGVAMEFDEFRALHDSIKEKCLFMKSHQEDDPRQTAAMATLLQFFGIQIPRSISETTRKRALMMAAQHQYDRVKENVGIQEAMKICNVPMPEVRNDRFKCFGVMYLKHHRQCLNCGLRQACEAKAMNFGLGLITISHKLLGTRHARVPVLAPVRSIFETAPVESEREEEILTFLDENFRRVVHQGETCYRHKDRLEKNGMQFIFSIGKQIAPLRLRFINPAEPIKASLKLESGPKGGTPSWYMPSGLTAEEAIDLIRAHAQMTFTKD